MKGLDTPVLLAILHDSPPAKELLKGLRGEELATTEINIFELGVLAAAAPRRLRGGREATLSRLRRRLTVLAIGPESVREAARCAKGNSRADYQSLVWGTLAGAGCDEWITTRAFAPAKGVVPFKLRLI
ncbi:MAG: PIN domain-containing protein [Thermoplasmata archaeon]